MQMLMLLRTTQAALKSAASDFLFPHAETIQSSSDIHKLFDVMARIKHELEGSLWNSDVSLWDSIIPQACRIGLKPLFSLHFAAAFFKEMKDGTNLLKINLVRPPEYRTFVVVVVAVVVAAYLDYVSGVGFNE